MGYNAKVLVMAIAVLLLLSGLSFAQTQYEVLFTCDMAVQIAVGNFDPTNPDTNKVWVRGSFNGWGTTDEMSPSAFDSTYSAVVLMDFGAAGFPDTAKYKFYYEHPLPGGTIGQEWESGPDRDVIAQGNEPDLNGNGIPDIIVPTRYWSDIGFDDIFASPQDVIFEVDMRPAYAYLAKFDSITYGGYTVTSIDCVYIASGHSNTTPAMAWVWDLPSLSQPEAKALKMNDDGVNGDATAGDSVWTITVNFHTGAAKNMVWKFGIEGKDNEAGFAKDHSANIYNPPTFRIHNQFGDQDSAYYGMVWDYENMVVGIEDHNFATFAVPEAYHLEQNYPNPFNPTTKIEYALTKKANIEIAIYNVAGQKVRTLVSGTVEPGVHNVVWDARNDAGQQVAAGIYLYQLKANNYTETKKMVLLK
ncbi:MAG: hypothetical protein Kow0037_02240 [Calditrichia bacterium]